MPPLCGGSHKIKYLNASVFFIIAIFGFLETINKTGEIRISLLFAIPFIILVVLNLIIKSNYLDIISNMLLMIGSILFTPYGNLTAAIFLLLSIHSINNKYQYYVIFIIFFVSIIYSSSNQNVSIFQVAVILIGYFFIISKYFITIHLPTEKMKHKIKYLENQLFIVGAKDTLSNDQILLKYPYMRHSGYNPYRKIDDIRLLANNKIYKEIAAINNITEQNQSREFSNMKKNFSIELSKPVETQISLIKSGIELGIIHIKCRH